MSHERPDLGSDELARRLASWMSTVATEPSADWLNAAIADACDGRQTRPLTRLLRVPLRVRRPSAIMLARIAAACLLIVAGVVVVQHRSGAPNPGQTPTPTVVPSPSAPTATTTTPTTTSTQAGAGFSGPFAGVELTLDTSGARPAVNVVARTVDGSVQTLRRVTSDGLPDGADFNGFGKISRTGWLALSVGDQGTLGWAFVELAHPERPLRFVRGLFDGGSWSPTDLLALGQSATGYMVIDPVSGAITEVVGVQPPGGAPDLIWDAKGSGLLSSAGGGFAAPAPDDQPRTWSLTPLDGSGDIAGVPALDPWRGTRYVVAGGRWLTDGACGSVMDQCVPGDATAGAEHPVVVRDATGATTTWYDHDIADATLMDSTFSADGTRLWLLLYRPLAKGGELVLATVDAPHDVHVVRTDPSATVRFAGMWFAPDDSVVLINTTMVSTAPDNGDPPLTLTGRFAGFITVTVADAIASTMPPTTPTT